MFSKFQMIMYTSIPWSLLKNRFILRSCICIRHFCEQVQVREIKKVPPRLTKLINNPKQMTSWPTPTAVSELTVRCGAAGVSLVEMETFFIKDARKNSEKTGARARETFFYSKHILHSWSKQHSKEDISKFIEYFENSVLKVPGKVGLPIKRIEYVVAIWRLVSIIEDCIRLECSNLHLLADFGTKCSEEYKLTDILIYHSLAELQLKQSPTVPVQILPDLAELFWLVNHLPPLKGGGPSSQFPASLQLTGVDKALTYLLSLDLDDLTRSSILISLSLSRWRTSSFSRSLESLSEATFSLLQSFSAPAQDFKEERRDRVLVQLCTAWTEICTSACKQRMVPAIEYLLMQTEYFQKSIPSIGFLPCYLFLLSARQGDADPSLSTKLESRVSKNLRNEKFERCFIVVGMTEETKIFFINDFIKTCLKTLPVVGLVDATFSARAVAVETRAEAVDTRVPPTPGERSAAPAPSMVSEEGAAQEYGVRLEAHDYEVRVEMLDVRLLESIVRNDGTGLLDVFLTNAKLGVYPGAQATQAVVQYFSDNNDLDSLNLLFRGTSEDCDLKEVFYKEMSAIQFRTLMDNWERGRRLEAWISVVELYRSILSDRSEARIMMSTAEELVLKCRKISKLIIEANVDNPDSFEHAIRSGGLRIASEYRDVYILLTHWEGLFFSPKFESQQKAEAMMEEFPQLVKALKIDPVLSRAEKFNQEDIFRRLLQLNLRLNASPYNKSRTFESLLSFQTKSGNVTAGEQTIKTAKTLDVRITADYLQDFLELKEERAADRSKHLLTRAADRSKHLLTRISETFKNLYKNK